MDLIWWMIISGGNSFNNNPLMNALMDNAEN
jgi:hypothetical protein